MGHEVPVGEAGKWNISKKEVFEKVAKSLDFKEPGEDIKSVSSIPNMWARALSIEMALHDKQNKLRKVMVPQWEGMLAAIALADVYDFNLKAEFIDLATINEGNISRGGKQFAKSLRELTPSVKDHILYQIAEETDKQWYQIYVFLWNDRPVGSTSPSTLIYPSEDGDWTGLPWWSKPERKLLSPRPFITNKKYKDQLWLWLDNILQELGNQNHQGNEKAAGRVTGLIEEFRDSFGQKPQAENLTTNNQKPYFGETVRNHGPLIALKYPIALPELPSNVQVIIQSNQGRKPAVIYDPDLLRQWGQIRTPENVRIHKTVNYRNIVAQNREQLKRDWQGEVLLLESDDLLLPESDFHYIVQQDAFTTKEPVKDSQGKIQKDSQGNVIEKIVMVGALLPDGAELLKNREGDYITPLLPLKPLLLDYFTPQELIEMLSIEIRDGKAIITLRLTLSGMEGQNREYLLKREYPLKEENGKSDLPVLEVWPNFIFEGKAADNEETRTLWQEYYAFYSDGGQRDTFAVDLLSLGATEQDSHLFQNQDESQGKYHIVRLTKFPSHIRCQDSNNKQMGLILLPTPPRFTKSETEWTVGVDFGTSFTQVCIQRTGQPELLSFTPLSLSVTASKTSTRNDALYEFFGNEAGMRLPLSSVLTTRGTGGKQTDIRPLLDGRIYIPSNPLHFNPLTTWIHTGLKWSRDEKKETFLKHLALEITALAAKDNARKIQWAISYPTAYSEDAIRNIYNRLWQRLTEELQQKTGVEQDCPRWGNSRYYLTESLSLAKYFDGYHLEKKPFDRVTCIDVGGGTSDISIWENSKLIHQCSVKFAGRDLFTRILEHYPDWLSKYFKLPGNILASSSASNAENNLTEEKLDAKLDALLRENGDQWVTNKPDEEEFFQEFRQIMAIGWAGLYYYIGILLKVLHEGEQKDQSSSPPIGREVAKLAINQIKEAMIKEAIADDNPAWDYFNNNYEALVKEVGNPITAEIDKSLREPAQQGSSPSIGKTVAPMAISLLKDTLPLGNTAMSFLVPLLEGIAVDKLSDTIDDNIIGNPLGKSSETAQQRNSSQHKDEPAPKYSQPKITPVYLGGNGSRLLHWLEIGGEFDEDDSKLNRLFSRMIAAGSGFPDLKVKTKLSKKPKEEVAIGLVLGVKNSRLEGLEDVDADLLIAGEAYKINDQKQKPFTRMQQGEGDYELNPPDVTEFETLPEFLYQFNLALKELKLTKEIPPLDNKKGKSSEQDVYQQSPQVADNLWLWQEVNSRMYHYMAQITGNEDQRENDSSFTIALKSLIDVLAQRWAAKCKKQNPS